MNSESEIAFVLPFFGKFPPWFAGFLLSCRQNPSIDWLIFTDIEPLPEKTPDNVLFEHLSYKDIQQRLAELLEMDLAFETPHKLCDVKPLYGLLFEEQLRQYDYWGHCDLDLIWGDLEGFLTRIAYEQYDIISTRKESISGHFTLYKNNEQTRYYFRQVPGCQKVFQNGKYAGFDEGYFAYHVYSHHQQDGLKVYWPQKYGVDWPELLLRPSGWSWQHGKILDRKGNERVYLHFMKWKKDLAQCDFNLTEPVETFQINRYGLWQSAIPASIRFRLWRDHVKSQFLKLIQSFSDNAKNATADPATIPMDYRIID